VLGGLGLVQAFNIHRFPAIVVISVPYLIRELTGKFLPANCESCKKHCFVDQHPE